MDQILKKEQRNEVRESMVEQFFWIHEYREK